MILEIDDEELTWLKTICGGPYDPSTKTLGQGMTGEKVLRFRAKLHKLGDEMTPEQALEDLKAGRFQRYSVPGKWSVYWKDNVPTLEIHGEKK